MPVQAYEWLASVFLSCLVASLPRCQRSDLAAQVNRRDAGSSPFRTRSRQSRVAPQVLSCLG